MSTKVEIVNSVGDVKLDELDISDYFMNKNDELNLITDERIPDSLIRFVNMTTGSLYWGSPTEKVKHVPMLKITLWG